jgi:formate C-acetyltransferase
MAVAICFLLTYLKTDIETTIQKEGLVRRYRGGYLSWNYWVAYAPTTAATPDGRRRGQFLSNAVCPVNGMDRKGPTAVIKSVGHLGLETAPNGASHTIGLSPSYCAAQKGSRR